MKGFEATLRQVNTSGLSWIRRGTIENTIEKRNNGRGLEQGRVKLVAQCLDKRFTDYLMGLGYDGFKTGEGGEGDIGSHDTYLIFGPSNVKVMSETNVELKA